MDNDKRLEEALDELENFNPSDEQIEKFKEMKDEYSDKSEEEILFEIIKLNKKMESKMSEEDYNELFEKLETIRPLLSEEQSEKLDEILNVLSEE